MDETSNSSDKTPYISTTMHAHQSLDSDQKSPSPPPSSIGNSSLVSVINNGYQTASKEFEKFFTAWGFIKRPTGQVRIAFFFCSSSYKLFVARNRSRNHMKRTNTMGNGKGIWTTDIFRGDYKLLVVTWQPEQTTLTLSMVESYRMKTDTILSLLHHMTIDAVHPSLHQNNHYHWRTIIRWTDHHGKGDILISSSAP